MSTAEGVTARLLADPKFHKEMAAREKTRELNNIRNRQDAAPLVAALRSRGYDVDSVSDLFHRRLDYKAAIPLLLDWLPRVLNPATKEEIVRALTVKWARPIAAPKLIAELRKENVPAGLAWAIGNALSVVADDSVLDEIIGEARNPARGKAREMLTLALANMHDSEARDAALQLLSDEEVAGHAVMALGKMRCKTAQHAIEPFLNHPKSWVRSEAKKALARIDGSGRRSAS